MLVQKGNTPIRRAFVKPDVPSGISSKEGNGSPRFPGNPIAHLPCSQTPDGVWRQTFTTLHCCPRGEDNEGSIDEDFVAQSHGFCAHCLRFMPPLLTTMQNSFRVWHWWSTFAGWDFKPYPQGFVEEFLLLNIYSNVIYYIYASVSPLPGLSLALPRFLFPCPCPSVFVRGKKFF